MTNHPSPSDLTQIARAIWNNKADFWDELMGDEGNTFQRQLIMPASERLLDLMPGEWLLDAGCGNGIEARRAAQAGCHVLAFDGSPRFLEIARQRGERLDQETVSRIDYRLIDATAEAELATLPSRHFDAACCLMVLMDLPVIEPLLAAIYRSLKPGGRFVFAVPHPVFNHSGTIQMAEQIDNNGELELVYSVKMSRYSTPYSSKGVGALGEPEPHYYFHRPLSQLLGACFQAGFLLDRLEEPTFDGSSPSTRPLSWARYQEIPPALVARMRKPVSL